MCLLVVNRNNVMTSLIEKGIKALILGYRDGFLFLYTKALFRFFGTNEVSMILSKVNKKQVKLILKWFGADVTDDCDLEPFLKIHNAQRDYSNLKIGRKCHVGKDVFFDLRAPIVIEDLATISMRVTILTHLDVGHSLLREDQYPKTEAPVRICRGVYVGAGATILKGVTIGECSIVGAGAVVTKDVPPNTVVAGVPAKVIKKIE